LNSIPEQIYVLHLTKDEIVYTVDPKLTKLFNANVIKENDKITINICWLKCLYIKDLCWSNIIFFHTCYKHDKEWARTNNLLVDSMLLSINCDNTDNVDIQQHIMNVVKTRRSKQATSKYMIEEVSKLYNNLKTLQRNLSERNDVYVTSWGIPLNETEILEILKLID